jgi:hypothetical protein
MCVFISSILAADTFSLDSPSSVGFSFFSEMSSPRRFGALFEWDFRTRGRGDGDGVHKLALEREEGGR